jgi:hypothetical protein
MASRHVLFRTAQSDLTLMVTFGLLFTSINVVEYVQAPLRRNVTHEETGTIDCSGFDALDRGFR